MYEAWGEGTLGYFLVAEYNAMEAYPTRSTRTRFIRWRKMNILLTH